MKWNIHRADIGSGFGMTQLTNQETDSSSSNQSYKCYSKAKSEIIDTTLGQRPSFIAQQKRREVYKIMKKGVRLHLLSHQWWILANHEIVSNQITITLQPTQSNASQWWLRWKPPTSHSLLILLLLQICVSRLLINGGRMKFKSKIKTGAMDLYLCVMLQSQPIDPLFSLIVPSLVR